MKRRALLNGFGALIGASALTSCAQIQGQQTSAVPQSQLRGTGDLAVAIARADGRVAVIDTTEQQIIADIPGIGDLSPMHHWFIQGMLVMPLFLVVMAA